MVISVVTQSITEAMLAAGVNKIEEQREEIARLHRALFAISEYWNGTPASAVDAIETAVETALSVLPRGYRP